MKTPLAPIGSDLIVIYNASKLKQHVSSSVCALLVVVGVMDLGNFNILRSS